MAGNATAASELGSVILQDYFDNGSQSAYCRWLEFQDELGGPGSLAARTARGRLCQPPPPPPPTEDFFNAGGVPCRLYRVVYESGLVGSPGTPTQLDRRGPIGRIQREITQPDGKVGRVITLTSGTGIGCPRVYDQMAGTNDVSINNVFARIISITPLEGTPETEIPVWRNPLEDPQAPPQPFNFEINVDIAGVEVNAPITFGPVVNTNFGPVVPFTFAPTANFNPAIDITLGSNPQFGLDIDLEFVIPLGGPTNAPQPLPGAEPVPLPEAPRTPGNECPEFDYERIEDAINDARCCVPITRVDNIATHIFDGPNDVFIVDVPDDTVAVFLGVIPGNNTRVFKFAEERSEYGHGNASLLVNDNALGFERIFVNNHVLFFPEGQSNKSIRVSLQEGTTVVINAGRYVPTEE